jgi:capsular exopolysaccharide synthesis family protein
MMYRDEEQSGTHEPQQAMIGGSHPPSDSLVVQNNGVAPAALAVPGIPGTASQDVLRGGMDANTFLNALRRRWLLASLLGAVVGAIAAIVLWVLFPESSRATALFEVSNEQKSLVFDYSGYNPQSFEILKKTQLAKLSSYYVLQAAVRDPGIASLSIFAGEPDPVLWLQENLEADFPQQGEILSISLAANAPPEDLQRLVDEVAKAYEEEVVFDGTQTRLNTRDLLAQTLKKTNEELTDKLQIYLDMAKDLGKAQGTDARDPHTDLMLREIASLQQKKDALESQMMQMQTEFAIMKSRIDDPQMIEAKVDYALQTDARYQIMQYQVQMLAMQSMQGGGTRRARRGGGADAKLQQAELAAKQYRDEMIKQAVREHQSKPNLALQQLQKEYQTLLQSSRVQLTLVNNAFKQGMEGLNNRLERSVELENRANELKQLQEIANDMSIKLEGLDVEANAPAQIKQVQPAVARRGINKMQHYSISALGGIAGFALTCIGIAYLEFRNRRLDGPDQVDEGLGIRVVGTLPSLSSRKALDPSHPVVAQLTESIDGVRTILMHDSTSKRRQVVLITSAATMEGRTTVASQLAASLARAGRRTLLIDGDLRRPALHALFDVPLEDGLCEVLRAEVDVADVIRPTHAEGLWLLTAGYCDIDAIHALATEQMQPVFDKLRSEYDFIIIDGAPVLGMSDALIFGQYSDGAILSVRRDHSQMPKINQAAELLRGVGIRIMGSVVNGVPAKADDRITQMRLIAPKSERELQPSA